MNIKDLAIGATLGFIAVSTIVYAQVPAYQPIRGTELMTPPGSAGTDYSANQPTLDGLTLLNTIPDEIVKPRRGYVIQAQCLAGMVIVFDTSAGGPFTAFILSGGLGDGNQGASLDSSSMPHSGRIRIYSSNPSCQFAARTW